MQPVTNGNVAVIDMYGFIPYVERVCPKKFEVVYLMDIVLLLIEKSQSITDIVRYSPEADVMVDQFISDDVYEEAMARGVTDDEYTRWQPLFKEEVIQCAIQIAQTLYHPLKPALRQYAGMYPNGYVLQVHQLARDGLYVDLTNIQPQPQ